MCLLATLLLAAASSDEQPVIAYDVVYVDDADGDGHAELTTYYEDTALFGEVLTGAAWDTTGDGALDLWYRVNRDWRVDLRLADTDADGRPDQAIAVDAAGVATPAEPGALGPPVGARPADGGGIPPAVLGGMAAAVLAGLAAIVLLARRRAGPAVVAILVGLASVALPAPPGFAQEILDEDCNLNEEVFEAEWERYSTFDELSASRSHEVQEFYQVVSRIERLLLEGFQLEVDQELDRQTAEAMREYRAELVASSKKNLLRAFIRLAFLTTETIYNTAQLKGSVGKLIDPQSGLEIVGAIVKITDAHKPTIPGKKQTVADAVEGVGWGAFKDALESTGNPKDIVVGVVTQTMNETRKAAGGFELTEEDIALLRAQHLDRRALDQAKMSLERKIGERDRRLAVIDARLLRLDGRLEQWRDAEKQRVRDWLTGDCDERPTTTTTAAPATTSTTPATTVPVAPSGGAVDVGAAAGTYPAYEPSFRLTVRPSVPVGVLAEEGAVVIGADGSVAGGFAFAWTAQFDDDTVVVRVDGTFDPTALYVGDVGLAFDTMLRIEYRIEDEGRDPLWESAVVPVFGSVDPAAGLVQVIAENETLEFRR